MTNDTSLLTFFDNLLKGGKASACSLCDMPIGRHCVVAAAAMVLALHHGPLAAASFEIFDGQVEMTQQVLGDGEAGIIHPGGALQPSTYLDALLVTGAGASINNEGTIRSRAAGITVLAGDATVVSSGQIDTTGFADGIALDGPNANATVSGTINTLGNDSHGISVSEVGTTVVASGAINTAGFFASGIYSSTGDVTLRNSGSIHTAGFDAPGIESGARSFSDPSLPGSGTGVVAVDLYNGGLIQTDDERSSGIVSNVGSNAVVSSSVSGPTRDASATSDTRIVNRGTIHTLQKSAAGIWSSSRSFARTEVADGKAVAADRVTVINRGDIRTDGESSAGIDLDADADSVGTGSSASAIGTIENNGSIRTNGEYAPAIDAFSLSVGQVSVSVRITNTGEIDTREYDSSGMQTWVDTRDHDSVATPSGLAAGITSSSMLVNAGNITTRGDVSSGMRSAASAFAEGLDETATADVAVLNSGHVRSSGSFALGIDSSANANGAASTVTVSIANYGSIATSGKSADGLFSRATGSARSGSADVDVTISNSGDITTTGDQAPGIRSEGFIFPAITGNYAGSYYSRIVNSGSISTAGRDAPGIRADSTFPSGYYSVDEKATTLISNTGSIVTVGDGAFGIQVAGSNTTVDNSGLIQTANAHAIQGDDVSQTLNILPGSRIVGVIDMGGSGDDDTANIYSASSHSEILTFENTENINLFIENAHRVNANTVVIYEPVLMAAQVTSLANFSNDVHRFLGQRLRPPVAFEPVQVAALELTPGLFHTNDGRMAWGQALGGTTRLSAGPRTGGFDDDYGALMAGYEFASGEQRVGWLAGVARANTRAVDAGSDTDSLFAGVYGNVRRDELYLSGSVIVGSGWHESGRTLVDNLAGPQYAASEFNSYYLSPSLSLGRVFNVDADWELRPSLTASYTLAHFDSYQESGASNANLHVDSRLSHVLSTRWQVEAAHRGNQGEVSLYAGLQSRHIRDDAVDASMAAGDFRIGSGLDDNAFGGFVGTGGDFELTDRLRLQVDVDYGWLSSDERHLSGQATLEYRY
ncbi:MAG: autotransporter domain-containing protein [Sedimenticolaceae bacterium]